MSYCRAVKVYIRVSVIFLENIFLSDSTFYMIDRALPENFLECLIDSLSFTPSLKDLTENMGAGDLDHQR